MNLKEAAEVKGRTDRYVSNTSHGRKKRRKDSRLPKFRAHKQMINVAALLIATRVLKTRSCRRICATRLRAGLGKTENSAAVCGASRTRRRS